MNTRKKIQEILQGPKLMVLSSTKEDGSPWGRYVMAAADDQLVIRFTTFTGARKVEDIRRDSRVHLVCGGSEANMESPYLQIAGKASVSTDPTLKAAIWNEALSAYFSGPDDPNFAVVEVTPLKIEYWGGREPEIWTAE